ncbi:hypothetical protein CAEBREN_25413 [Caenorhabditis brenneri]|uniref:Uncharacterized protein n=1 Tax=Caenorhabditis brenneri TaxID=135651 RepID=G0N694_CAEBE|nr:hypothetical protein CAEBREN_25413 [Caenorhabditis brenneri]
MVTTDTTHDDYNPYTAVQRSPSQWFIWVPQAAPMNNTTVLTLSHDAVNLNTIPLSASKESMASFESRYVVPEVIDFQSSSEVDTRSAGNPYAHHPNYTTPSQYFNHMEDKNDDVLTVMDIEKLKDPFGRDKEGVPEVKINPPNDVTINKHAFTSESLADLRELSVTFPTYPSAPAQSYIESPTETINKKMLSPDSMYELGQLSDQFEQKESNINSLVLREFSPQTLADLREIRNFSQYTDFPGPTKDVATAMGISPSPYERHQFELTENVAYGGI